MRTTARKGGAHRLPVPQDDPPQQKRQNSREPFHALAADQPGKVAGEAILGFSSVRRSSGRHKTHCSRG